MILLRDPVLVRKMNAKYSWKDVPIPSGALLSVKEAHEAFFKGKKLYVVLPHVLELWTNVQIVGPHIKLMDYDGVGNYLDFEGANLEGRVDFNANFVFANYWHAYAYLNKFRAPS